MWSDEEEEPSSVSPQKDRSWRSTLVFRERRGLDSITLNDETQTVQISLDTKALNRMKTSQEQKLTLVTLSWENLEPSRVHYYICEVGLLDDTTDLSTRIIEGLMEEEYKTLRYLAEKFFREFQTKVTRVLGRPLALELAHPNSNGFDELKSSLGTIEDLLVDICTHCVGNKVRLNVTLRLGEEREDLEDMEFTLTIYGSDTESDDINDPNRKAISPREQHPREEDIVNRLQVIEEELQTQKAHFNARFDEQEANNKQQGALLSSVTEKINKILQKHEELLQVNMSNQMIHCQGDVRPKTRTPKAAELPNRMDPRLAREVHQLDKTPEKKNVPPPSQKLSSSSPNLSIDINSITSRPTSGVGMNISPVAHRPERRGSYDQKQPEQTPPQNDAQLLQTKVPKLVANDEPRFESVRDNDLFPTLLEEDRSKDWKRHYSPRTGSAQASPAERSTSSQTLVLSKEGTDGMKHGDREESPKPIGANIHEMDPSKQMPNNQGPQQMAVSSSQEQNFERTNEHKAHSLPLPDDIASERDELHSNSLRIDRHSDAKGRRGEENFLSFQGSTPPVSPADRSTSKQTRVLSKEDSDGMKPGDRGESPKQIDANIHVKGLSKQMPNNEGPQQLAVSSSQKQNLERTKDLEVHSSPLPDDISSERDELHSNSLRIDRHSDAKGRRGEEHFLSFQGSTSRVSPAERSTSKQTLVLSKEDSDGMKPGDRGESPKQIEANIHEKGLSKQMPNNEGHQQLAVSSSQKQNLERTKDLEVHSSPLPDYVSSERDELHSNSLRTDHQPNAKDRRGEEFVSSLPASLSQVTIEERTKDKRTKPQKTGNANEEKQIETEMKKPEQEQKEQIRAATLTISLQSSHSGLGRARYFLNKHGVHGSTPGVRRMIQTIEAAMRGDDELPPKTKGMNTVLCLDTSSDIGEDGFQTMKEAVLEYLEGIEDIAATYETEENIAVVSFGERSQILHHLSNDYTSIRTVVETLDFGGKGSLFEALLVCLCEIDGRASPTTIGETPYHPRIIIVTGGNTIDNIEESGLEEDTIVNNSKERVVKFLDDVAIHKDNPTVPQALVWIPIPTEHGDRGYVEFLSEMENCSLCECKDMKNLCKYQRTQEILESSYSQIRDSIVLTDDSSVSDKDISDVVEVVGGDWEKSDKDEIVADLKRRLNATLNKTHLIPSDFNNVVELEDPELPRLGERVIRGKDWPGGEAGGGGAGTVVNHIDGQQTVRKIIWVLWDNGECKKYKYGFQNAHDVMVIKDRPRFTRSGLMIEIGCEVTRGRDWMSVYENQDGGPGEVGVVIRKDDLGNVKVRWQQNGRMCDYRYGINNKIDLHMRDPVQSLLSYTASSVSSPDTSIVAEENTTQDEPPEEPVWVWQRRTEGEGWVLYDETLNQKLEREYNKRKEGSCVIQRNGACFRVSFKFNTEKKVDEDSKADVRRICMSRSDLAAKRDPASEDRMDSYTFQ